MPPIRERILALVSLVIFLAGTLAVCHPVARPRIFGRSKSHTIFDSRPRGRTRLDAIAPEEAAPGLTQRIASASIAPARSHRPPPRNTPDGQIPLSGRLSARSSGILAHRLIIPLRC